MHELRLETEADDGWALAIDFHTSDGSAHEHQHRPTDSSGSSRTAQYYTVGHVNTIKLLTSSARFLLDSSLPSPFFYLLTFYVNIGMCVQRNPLT